MSEQNTPATGVAGQTPAQAPAQAAETQRALDAAAREAERQRFDETQPGGWYLGTDGTPHDAHGNIREREHFVAPEERQERTAEAEDASDDLSGEEEDPQGRDVTWHKRSARAAGVARGTDAGEPGRPAGERLEDQETPPFSAHPGLTASEEAIRDLPQPITATEPASIDEVQSGALGPVDPGAPAGGPGGASRAAAKASRELAKKSAKPEG